MGKRQFIRSHTKLHIPDLHGGALCHWNPAQGTVIELSADEYQTSEIRVCLNCAAVWRSMHNGDSYIATVVHTSYRWQHV